MLARAIDAVAPGKKESDVAAVARQTAHELGSEAGILLCSAGQLGEPAPLLPRHLQNRVLREGDLFAFLVEVDGPGGMYAEIGRTISLGPVPAEASEEFEFVLAAQRHTLDLMKPGTPAAAVWDGHNAYMVEHGRPPEQRVHCHGQGYDLVERPFIRDDEPMTIEVGMNFACHPGYVQRGLFAWVCDNYLIGPDGPGPRLHTFPQEIVER